MRLMQRLAISGLLSVILILLLTGTFITGRRDLASVVDRGVAPEERNEQLNPAWVQDNVVPGQDEPEIEDKDKDRRLDINTSFRHKLFEPSVVEAPAASVPGVYVVRSPNPPLDDITNQRREKVKEMMKHGWDNYVRYAWGKNELRPISKRGHSASIFGASNMGATIVDGLDTLYIMGLHDEFKQGRDWIAENLDFDILLVFITRQYNAELLFMNLSLIFPTVLVTMLYLFFTVKINSVKLLLEQIQDDCNLLKDKLEIDILEKYASNFGFFIQITMALCYFGAFSFGILQYLPLILDVILPINKSQPLQLFVYTEYLINPNKYIHFMILHEWLTICIGLTTVGSSGLTCLVYVAHLCMLLKIASYRIENVTENMLAISNPRREHLLHQRVVHAVIIHQRAIEYHKFIMSVYLVPSGILFVIMIIGLIVALFRCSLQFSTSNDKSMILINVGLISVYLIYLFTLNYCGQILIDNGLNFFEATYNGLWYAAPLSIQKLLLFVMQRGRIPLTLTYYDLITSSIDGFATLLVFITRQYNTDLLFKILSFVFPILFAIIKYFLFIIEANSLKQLLEQIQDDWNSLNDKLEIDIVEKYAGNMRLLTISSMAICYISVFFFGVFQRLPLILDAVLPLNESRPYQLFVMTEYFVSQDKYIHIMLLHEFLTVYIGLTTVCSTGLAIIIYMVHICVLLKIASYRIENAIKKNVLAIPSPRREYFLHRRIVHAVIIHQRAIEYHTFFMSVFLLPFGFLIAVGVNSVAFILFLSFQLMASNSKSMSFIAVGLVLICLTYMFVGNYYGQAVIDSGISLFKATYNGLWYSAPLSTQKLLLFIMQRGRIHLTFTFYSILISSLDGFAVLTSMAISYFTVIYAMQK